MPPPWLQRIQLSAHGNESKSDLGSRGAALGECGWRCDSAVLVVGNTATGMWRFAPFAQRIYIPLPEKEGRKQLLTINLRDVPLDADIALDDIAGRMDGYSGSDITNVLLPCGPPRHCACVSLVGTTRYQRST